MKLKKIVFLSTFALTIFGSSQVNADDIDDFVSFLRKHGQSAVRTEDGKYQSSTRHIYSAGSLSIRTPNYRINPITVTRPNFNVGCGGVDLYFGSFSFLKSEELERFARQVIAAAPYFAFKIALSSYSPSIEKVLSSLQSMAQLLSSTELDACETAGYSVNTMYELFNDFGSKGVDGTGASKQENLLYKFSAIGHNEWLTNMSTAYNEIKDSIVKFGPDDKATISPVNEPLLKDIRTSKNNSPTVLDDNLAAMTSRNPEVTQADITEYTTGGAVGNILYTNASKIEGKLKEILINESTAINSGNSEYSLINLIKGENELEISQNLLNFIFSLFGTSTGKFEGQSLQNTPEISNYSKTLTLKTLIEGGMYDVQSFDDLVEGGNTYRAIKQVLTQKSFESNSKKLMKKYIGDYKNQELSADPNTFLYKIVVENALRPTAEQQAIIDKLFSSYAVDNIGKIALTNPTLAATAAENCLNSLFLDIYYQDIQSINNFLNQVVSNGTNNIYPQSLRNHTRAMLNKSMNEYTKEYIDLKQQYGTYDSCVGKVAYALPTTSNAK